MCNKLPYNYVIANFAILYTVSQTQSEQYILGLILYSFLFFSNFKHYPLCSEIVMK